MRAAFALLLMFAAAQPAPATPPSLGDGPHLIFFDPGEAEVTARAAEVLDMIAAHYLGIGQGRLRIDGHSDRAGGEAYNRALSERRASSTRDYLVRRGIPESAVEIASWGEARPLVDTPDGVVEPQNRRAEILIQRSTERLNPR